MNIEIKPEDVDALVKDALLKAGIGKAITEAVAKVFSGYDSPIDRELKKYISEVASGLIRDKYGSLIREATAKCIEEKVTTQIIESTTSAAVEKMVRAVEDSRY